MAIAMKQGTMKKAKDTRLLITYSTLTCLYCVIIQKKNIYVTIAPYKAHQTSRQNGFTF